MINIAVLILLLFIIFLSVRITDSRGVCRVTFTACISAVVVIFWSSLFASYYQQLSNLMYWLYFELIVALLLSSISIFNTNIRLKVWSSKLNISILDKQLQLIFKNKTVSILCVLTIIIACINLFIIMWFEPGTPDVLEYHLTRVAYYLQQDSFSQFHAHYWAQVIYPLLSTSLFTFITLISDKNAGMSALSQWIAGCVSLLSIYGISRNLGSDINRAAISAFIFALLPIVITESATAQNDILMSAFTGIAVYFILEYNKKNKFVDLMMGIISIALLISVKFTWVLIVPSIFVIIFSVCKINIQKWLTIVWVALIFIILIILPSGYWQNFVKYNNPLGPSDIRMHYTSENQTGFEIVKQGFFNLLRYTVDGISLDGYVAGDIVNKIQYGMRYPVITIIKFSGVDMKSDYGVKLPYRYSFEKQTTATENSSGYGIAGLLLIFPAVICSLFISGLPRYFAISFILFAFIQSFASPYDYFHFRFFTMGAIFALPLIATAKWKTWYLSISLFFIMGGALSSAVCRQGLSFIPVYINDKWYPPYLPVSRSEQITRQIPDRQMMVELVDVVFPAKSKIALDLRPIIIEYVFFGELLNRQCVSIRDFQGKRAKLPDDTDFIIYSEDSPYYRKGDPVIIGGHERYGTIFYRCIQGEKIDD